MGAKIWQLLVTIFIKIWFTTAQTLDIDYASLHAIKASWQNTPPSWDDSSDPCGGWEGIKCTNSRVTNIVLTNLQLNGGFPEDIGNFTELQRLDLSYNTKLTGSLPAQAIDKLRKLQRLALVGCSFNGQIPDTIGNLESLTYLALNSNRFTGSIPASIGNLKSLDWLDLSGNRLNNNLPVSSGTMPGLDMLTSTKHFHLGGNQLSGDIPPSLFNSNMTLKHLLLENNNLTGNIPLTLGLVQSLKVVRLDRNSLSGNVPSNINNLTSVNEMFLSKNRLTGPIPDLTAMNALKYLDLSNNTFDESEVPSWFSTLQSLTTLNMHATNIGGELPAALFSIPDLQNVDLSNNRLSGTLSIGSTPSNQLQLVDLRTNQIGDFTQRGQDEVNITLVDNPICMGVGHTEKFCTAPQNTISSYSTTPNNCPLPPSCDSGQVSSPNCQCAYPFTGYFTFKAPSFSDLGNLTRYDSLRKLLMTYFKDYRYPIDSVSLKNATKSWEDYLRIKLEAFPSGSQTFNRTTINGLSSLFSNHEFKPGDEFNIYEFLADDYFSGSSRDKSSTTGLIIGSAVAGCVLLVLLVLAGMYAFRQKVLAERAAQQSHPFALWDPTSGSGGVPQLKGARSFSFEELKKYTSNFTEINNIGSGGYGMVYRGCLPNGQLIAIKRARKGSTQGGVEFKTEIELLSRVHHKNVVGLVGFCFDQGEQMLVYEYIVNGTLKDSLSGRSGIRLDWMRRLRIALGAARGLQYLHDLADPPIIHRDIKTNNILLDERLVAKVADFGLSKPLSDSDKTHITTQAKGTVGYMDPEYYMTQQLTEKSDIYSFGVVMLELITARRPIEKGKYIVREVKQAMNKSKELYNLQDLIDPTMGLSNQLKGLERFVDLSLRCVEEMGSQRPTMSEVVKEIESIIQVAGFNPYAESSTSTSKSYEGASKDYDYLYSNDSLFSYSGGFMPPKLQPK